MIFSKQIIKSTAIYIYESYTQLCHENKNLISSCSDTGPVAPLFHLFMSKSYQFLPPIAFRTDLSHITTEF